MATLIDNIGELTTNDPDHEGRLYEAAVIIEGETISWVGDAAEAPAADERFDAEGRALLPGWVDSHAHLLFAGDRTREFEARMAGASYAAGGINVTVQATQAASDEQLRHNLTRLLTEARRAGTTTCETKTGYGLTVDDEVRSARIAGEQVDAVTFLGAHVTPEGVSTDEYVDLVTGQMLEAVTPYVSAVDVFCEEGAFEEAHTRRVLEGARNANLDIRVHGNQLQHGPGVQLAVEYQARSVDHVAFVTAQDIDTLARSWDGGARGTVATVLPACDLSTRMPLAPARELIDAGARIAIASNCNPGTSYTTSMAFCVATAVLQMGLSVREAVEAATLGGAVALGMDRDGWLDPRGTRQPRVGVIAEGARADLHLLEAPSITHLAYRPGMPLTSQVWARGLPV